MSAKLILTEREDIDPFLTNMGLSHDGLVEVVRFAEAQRALCTSNDVRGFNLITVHDKAARGLREVFCGEDWEKDETDNQAGIRNPKLKLRVIPCNFDENAGNLDARPTNRVLKGHATRRKVRCNRTGWLPNLPMPTPMPGKSDFTTWVLGIFAEDQKPLAAELSLPLGFNGGRYFDFVNRIILDLRGDPMTGSQRRQPDRGGPVEDIDIEIKRKV
ncbi:hypothetical protein ACE7GA_06330 [Roseomonas sp. CCTCC AB2023176]|uniref:hypothetical protein n=1 Tax=Roseomonas sp. CCTCC AB2023176 TaxID=3342640 RepID=UPI0035D90B56